MKIKTLLFTVVLLFTGFQALSAGKVEKRGSFNLKRTVEKNDFSQSLLNLSNFAETFVKENTFEDFRVCPGWRDYIRVRSTQIDMCSTASLIGYKVVSKNSIKIRKTVRVGCAEAISIKLKVGRDTKPSLVYDNVVAVQTVLCLKENLKKVTYETSIEKGSDTSLFFYNYIKKQFLDSTPKLISTVKILLD